MYLRGIGEKMTNMIKEKKDKEYCTCDHQKLIEEVFSVGFHNYYAGLYKCVECGKDFDPNEVIKISNDGKWVKKKIREV